MPTKAFISWSSGKDSAYALLEARRQGIAEIVGVLTTLSEVYDRVAMHGVRSKILDLQIAALGVPAIKVMLPTPCPNEIYEERMAAACADIAAEGVSHIVFGDLFLADIRAYREERLGQIGMTPLFPLWSRPTRLLAREIISAGIEAHIACLDPQQMPISLAGRKFDEKMNLRPSHSSWRNRGAADFANVSKSGGLVVLMLRC
jgi:diphthamide synthase (EF-2-diphthine--ammonia ligase)